VDTNLIIVKTFFGCIFINQLGNQVPDPDFKKITPRENGLWEKYDFLKKKHIDPTPLRPKVQNIIERILSL
jgi:hypothetical protein